MSDRVILTEPLSAATFAPFGEVLQAAGTPDMVINQGNCDRFHDRATLTFGNDGRAGISLFQARPHALPYRLGMVERHPLGSQAFLPMSQQPFLVIVAEDEAGVPVRPRAFLTTPGQGVNYRTNTWHGVLTPLHQPGLFAVIDRIAGDNNLEEFWFETQYVVKLST